MRTAGIEGVRRQRRVRTTRADDSAPRHPDLVGRQFNATAPNELWVTDLAYVPTWAGVAYVCFIVDAYSRMIVGWRVAGHMRTEMVLDAIDMARWHRGARIDGVRCHSDAGSQLTSVRYGERLADIGAVPSIGTVGDSYDNALAETVNGLPLDPRAGQAVRAAMGHRSDRRSSRSPGRGPADRAAATPPGDQVRR
jgi:putative transposase